MDRFRWADGRDLLIRVVGPGVVLCGLTIAVGLALVGPLAGALNAEDALNRGALAVRGSAWDLTSAIWSYLGSTEMIVAVCLVVSISVGRRTRDWRLAAVPAIAIVLQLLIYLTVTALVPRERPSVERLDTLLPMSSFPSGHVGAATALYLAFILMASRIDSRRVRGTVVGVCIFVVVLVATGRFLRGMHHTSDLLVGAIIGAACAVLAYGWYRHRARMLRPQPQPRPHRAEEWHADRRPRSS